MERRVFGVENMPETLKTFEGDANNPEELGKAGSICVRWG